MFAQNFSYTEQENKSLEVGEYKVRIIEATDKYYKNNGACYVDVTVEIKDFPGYLPNRILLNDIPVVGEQKANGYQVTEDDVKRANQTLSRFLNCFGIPTEAVHNPQSWKGKTGMVRCNWQYDKNEPDHKSKKYKELYPLWRSAEKTSAAAPVTQNVATGVPKMQAQTMPGGAQEDIIF